MKHLFKESFLGLVLSLLFINASNASVVDFEDHGIFTRDTISGLDWLDLSVTEGQSINTVTKRITSGDLQDWRYATIYDFETLISDYLDSPYSAKFEGPYFGYPKGTFAALVSLLSPTWASSDGNKAKDVIGLLFTPDVIIPHYVPHFTNAAIHTSIIREDYAYPHSSYVIERRDQEGDGFGSFLIRGERISPIPVPGAAWLFCFGLIGLFGWTRKL